MAFPTEILQATAYGCAGLLKQCRGGNLNVELLRSRNAVSCQFLRRERVSPRTPGRAALEPPEQGHLEFVARLRNPPKRDQCPPSA
jgi:hypothetical protein